MEFAERLAQISKDHATRQAALSQALTPELRTSIRRVAEDHGAQRYINALNDGHDDTKATELAMDEMGRREQHLASNVLAHADPESLKATLHCSLCDADMPHVCVIDHNEETVATCVCGHWHKIPKDGGDGN